MVFTAEVIKQFDQQHDRNQPQSEARRLRHEAHLLQEVANTKLEPEIKMPANDVGLQSKQVKQILKAVAIRLKSLGCAVVVQSRMVSGRCSTSLIIGETRDAAAHLHAAESIGVQVVEGLGDHPALQEQFAQQLFLSTALLAEATIPKDFALQ